MTLPTSYGAGCLLTSGRGTLKKIVRRERLQILAKRRCLKEMRALATDISRILRSEEDKDLQLEMSSDLRPKKKQKVKAIKCECCQKMIEERVLDLNLSQKICFSCYEKWESDRRDDFQKKFQQNRDRMRSYLAEWC